MSRRVHPGVAVLLAVVAAACAGGGSYLSVRRFLNTHKAFADLGASHGPSAAGSTPAAPTSPTGVLCPQITIDAVYAKGRPAHLLRVIHVEGTSSKGDSEAWICRDDDGTLYYQGHDKRGPATAATSDYTILLGGPVRGAVTFDGSKYVATNSSASGTTRYYVGPSVFTVVHPDGSSQNYTVVRVES